MNNEEKLFWRVMRNKVLFTFIISLIKSSFKYCSYTYEDIISTEWMVKNKHYYLLKEKVRRGEKDLIFHTDICYGLIFKSPFSVFDPEEPLKSDIQFYKDLFNNYYDYLIKEIMFDNEYNDETNEGSSNNNNNNGNNNKKSKKSKKNNKNNSNGKNSQKDFIRKLIIYDNEISLSIVIDDFKLYQPTEYDLIFSITNKSLRASNYLYHKLKPLKISNDKLWKYIIPSVIFNNSLQDINKVIYYLLFEIKIVPSQKQVTKLMDDFNIDFHIYNTSIEVLLETCIIIATLNLTNKNWNLGDDEKKKKVIIRNSIKLGSYIAPDLLVESYLKEEFQPMPIKELNDFKNSLTKSQLGLIIKDINNSSNDGIDESIISRLYKMVIPFTGNSIYILNYLYYVIVYKETKDQDNFYKFIVSWEEKMLVFSNCGKRVDKQTRFFDYLIKENQRKTKLDDYEENPHNNHNGMAFLNYFFESLIHYDCVDFLIQLKHHFDSLGKLPKLSKSGDYFGMINSNEMFDCLYNWYPDQLRLSHIIPQNPSIAHHFKSKYPIEFKILLDSFNFSTLYVYKNSILKHFDDCEFKQSLIKFFKRNYLDNYRIEVIGYFDSNNSITNNQLKLQFLLDNYLFDKDLTLYKYLKNDEFIIVDGSINDSLLTEIVKRNDFISIEKVLLSKNKSTIEYLLNEIIRYANIKILQYIYNNTQHHWIIDSYNQVEEFAPGKIHFPRSVNHLSIYNYMKNVMKLNCQYIKLNKSFI